MPLPTTTTFRLAALVATTLVSTANAQIGLDGHFAPGRWDDTGMTQGTTTISEIVEFNYDVIDPDPSGGVSYRTCQFNTAATSNGVIRVSWDARYRHSGWNREFVLWAFTDSPTGIQFIPLVLAFDPAEPSISPDFHGTFDLQVYEGYQYGFQIGGSHGANDPNMSANLVMWGESTSTSPLQNDPTEWTKSIIFDGTTGIRPALRLEYGVSTGGGGVPSRTTDLTALPGLNGTTTFDWTFEGDNAYFQAGALLSLISDGDGGETVTPLVNQPTSGPFVLRGRSSLDFQSGNEFGLRVGGGNNDALSFIRGNLILSRFEAEQVETCTADLNGDGQINFFDVSTYLQAYSVGCP